MLEPFLMCHWPQHRGHLAASGCRVSLGSPEHCRRDSCPGTIALLPPKGFAILPPWRLSNRNNRLQRRWPGRAQTARADVAELVFR